MQPPHFGYGSAVQMNESWEGADKYCLETVVELYMSECSSKNMCLEIIVPFLQIICVAWELLSDLQGC